jgi:phosphatidylinositol-3-phosphatase
MTWGRQISEAWLLFVSSARVAVLRACYPALLLVLLATLPARASTAAPPAGVPRLRHVVVVVLENRERDEVVGDPAARYLNALRRRYADLTSYTAVSHPSLPNYLALVSGSTHGIDTDCASCAVRAPSIGTLLSRKGLAWGGYAQGYPSSPRFAKKHMPFLYFPGGAAHVHPLAALDSRRLPAFALVAPDLCDDAHDCPLGTADAFVARFLPPLLRVRATAVVVVFDEGTSDVGGGGHVYAVVAGTAVRAHSVSASPTTHYGLLRTIEDALGLGRLGASASARPITGIWR